MPPDNFMDARDLQAMMIAALQKAYGRRSTPISNAIRASGNNVEMLANRRDEPEQVSSALPTPFAKEENETQQNPLASLGF